MNCIAVELRHVASGAWRAAELYSPAREVDRDDFESLWQPLFEQRRAELKPQSVDEMASYDLQDMHWEWRRKTAHRSSYLRSFAIACDGHTQGLMLVSLDPLKVSRAPGQEGRGLVYVELIATAPWNRPRLIGAARYKGVGRIFLSAAISLSVEEECGGRIGLHALPQSESWYQGTCQMTDLGTDNTYYPDYPLRYFEMTEVQARAFVS